VLVKPLVEKETLGQLTSEPGPVLELLRCLAKAGILEKMSNGWKETLAGGLGVVLKGLDTMGEFQVSYPATRSQTLFCLSSRVERES